MTTRGQGPIKVNGVQIGEFQADLLGPFPVLTAKVALVDVDNSQRFGASHHNAWSAATVQKLLELVASMETDVCDQLFGGARTAQPMPLPPDDRKVPEDEVPGL